MSGAKDCNEPYEDENSEKLYPAVAMVCRFVSLLLLVYHFICRTEIQMSLKRQDFKLWS